jgi:hypothetical protein
MLQEKTVFPIDVSPEMGPPRQFAKVHAKRRPRAGKKLKDMSKDELRAYWRKQAAAKREREAGKKKPARNDVSDEKLERMQKLDKKIKAVSKELDEIPESQERERA